MFQTDFKSIIRSTKLHKQLQACLTLFVQFCAPDDGRKKRLKHVECLTYLLNYLLTYSMVQSPTSEAN